MQVSVETLSTLERRLTVVVPVERVEQAFDKQLVKLSKTVKVNGFRKGKIPLDFIRQRYGDTARQEALGEVIQSSLYTAINQEKLSPVGVPAVEPKTVIPGQPLEFVATFEVLPEVETVKFAADTIEKQVSTITDQDVDTVLEHLRGQNITWTVVEQAAENGDQVVIDFSGSIDGKVFQGGEAHDYPVVIGSKTMIPGYEEGLIGLSAGQEKVITVTFPDDYFAKEFAGKAAEFAVKVVKVSKPNLPSLNEAFIKKMGVKSGSIDDFRAEVRKNLERELQRMVTAKLKKQIFDLLLQQNPIEVPKALIEREANRIHDELHPHHAGKHHGHSAEEMAAFNDAAKQNVALGMLIAKMVKQHNILPDGARIAAKIEQLSSVYENPAEVAKWYATNKKAKAEVEMQVLEEQLVETLLASIQVSEKMMSYSEFIKTLNHQ